MTSSIQPGTVLGGRYLLADLLDDVEGARIFRAVDQVLERNVCAYVVPDADPRASTLLAAARHSATVTDPHLLRVLDADVDGGRALTWVVSEWGAGQSLDTMVSAQPLPGDRAAWLVREVAAAVAVAHAHGLAHGRLAPENVMVTVSGTVRLIGFGLDAAVQRGRLRSGNYPDCTPQEADLFDLAGLLYASLVCCWPGASGSHLKAAPRDARGPLRPRQVRAGVPRILDAICGRVLGRAHPDRTAHQLSAVLTEYIGELATADPALAAVTLPEVDSSLDDLAAATGTHGSRPADAPVVPAAPGDTTTPLVSSALLEADPPQDIPARDTPARDTPARDTPAAGPGPSGDDTVLVPATDARRDAAEEDTGLLVLDPDLRDESLERPWDEEPLQTAPPGDARDAGPDTGPLDDDTQHGVPDFVAADDQDADRAAELDPDWHRPRDEPRHPLPAFDPVPERPLFAPEGSRRRPRGAVPTSATAQWGTEVAAARIAAGESPAEQTEGGTGPLGKLFSDADTGTDIGAYDVAPAQRQPHWPLGEDDPHGVKDDWEERTRRPWLRLPVIVLVVAVIAVLVAGGLALSGRSDLSVPGISGGGGDDTPSTPAPTSGQALKITAVKDLDPFAVPPEENPDEVDNAVDGDPATAWETVTYRGRPELGGLKPGVGLLIDLGSIQRVASVDLRMVGTGTDLSVYTAPTAATSAPSGIEGLDEAAQRTDAGETLALPFDQAVRTRYVVVWLTSLPPASGGFRGGVAEVVVRS